MNTKQRDVVYQRWSGVIRRETRDLTSLEQTAARALGDSDVRDDPTLQSMIRADIQKRRIELVQESQSQPRASAPPEPHPDRLSERPTAVSDAKQHQDFENFNRLVLALSTSLERRDEKETKDILAKMKALQERSPHVIPAAVIEEYAGRVEKLRIHLAQITTEIAALTERAVLASRNGNEQDLVRSMLRLTAIHAAHPNLLDELELEDIRRAVVDAADEHRLHRRTIKKLRDRERTINAQIKTLAAAVREFHRVALTVPGTTAAFRDAEATYLRTIQEVRTYDAEWFSGIVLELADLLAEWSVPPLGAEGQIDRFLDGIDKGLECIRAEMRVIESEQDSDDSHESESASG